MPPGAESFRPAVSSSHKRCFLQPDFDIPIGLKVKAQPVEIVLRNGPCVSVSLPCCRWTELFFTGSHTEAHQPVRQIPKIMHTMADSVQHRRL